MALYYDVIAKTLGEIGKRRLNDRDIIAAIQSLKGTVRIEIKRYPDGEIEIVAPILTVSEQASLKTLLDML